MLTLRRSIKELRDESVEQKTIWARVFSPLTLTQTIVKSNLSSTVWSNIFTNCKRTSSFFNRLKKDKKLKRQNIETYKYSYHLVAQCDFVSTINYSASGQCLRYFVTVVLCVRFGIASILLCERYVVIKAVRVPSLWRSCPIGSLSNDDGDSNEKGKKAIGLYQQNNNFARDHASLYSY